MSFTKETVLEKLERAYGSSYDLIKHEDKSEGLLIEGEFHVHSENYVISKKAQLYQMDSNEYLYVFYYHNLTVELFENAISMAYDLGFPKIEPNENHRSSYIVAEFICDTCDEDALKALKKYRKRQSFQFSLHGWMEMHTALIDLRSESVVANSDGRLCGKFLKNVLHPKKRRGIRLF